MSSVVAQAWETAVRELGGAPDPARAAAAELVRRYRQPHRRYHTLTHIEAVLAACRSLADALELDDRDRAIADLAVCAHDVVYDATPGSDERASAMWAEAELSRCGLAADDVRRVAAIVLATIRHTTDPGDLVGSVVLDADLAILAAEPGEYARYVTAVRAEYGALSDSAWRSGRAAVLRNLLARPVLFATEPARLRWADRARRNMTRELAALADDPAAP
jgi:predicted metal-dependent HD superfamily phosphohydrolase